MATRRQKAKIKRAVVLALTVIVSIGIAVGAIYGINALINYGDSGDDNATSKVQGSKEDEKDKGGNAVDNKGDEKGDKKPTDDYDPDNKEIITDKNGVQLDANFRRVLLVNGDNPLPDDYDSNIRKDLVTIDQKYRNNNYVTDIHKDVYPYITAMVAAANADGVDLKVWSPFRSYAIQKDLFQKQVNRVGGDEIKAATVVARPGTSEHNTGLCADFNMASDSFEKTKMFTWMMENAEDYGFILRYPKDKIDVTGVIYESWHWRFVGINTAKEINEMGVTLEEYVEIKKIDWKSELN